MLTDMSMKLPSLSDLIFYVSKELQLKRAFFALFIWEIADLIWATFQMFTSAVSHGNKIKRIILNPCAIFDVTSFTLFLS